MKWSYLRVVLLMVWLSVPVFLWIQPAAYFNSGPPLCPSKLLLDRECPGCGLMRATQHFMHFEFKRALDYNKLVLVTFPACVMVFFHVIGLIIQRPMFRFLEMAYRRRKP
jgi:hypothetical protein